MKSRKPVLRAAQLSAMWLLALVVVGCAGSAPQRLHLSSPANQTPSAASGGAAALQTAAEAYYRATTVAELRAAVAEARRAAPGSALTLELEADLAGFEDRRFERFDALFQALLDPTNDNAALHLHWLNDLNWTLAEGERARALLRALVEEHPDGEVRGIAAWALADLEHMHGRSAPRDAAKASLAHRLKWSVIGTWDNDQGKGFDVENPPERQLDLKGKYRGKLVDVTWRPEPVEDPRGHLDMGGLMDPPRWQVAYLAAAIAAPAAGDFELRIGTTDPIKIWVNDVLVFQVSAVSEWLPEALVIPVRLRAGVNRVLVKQAHEDTSWLFAGRLTGPGGAAPVGLTQGTADAPYAEGALPGPVVTIESMVERRVAGMPVGSARRAFMESEWAERMGLRVLAVSRAEAFAAKYGQSLIARYQLAGALWDNQERGNTSDILAALVKEAGADLPWIRLQQARFFRQQNLGEQARAELLDVKDKHGDRPTAAQTLADVFGDEGWHEDRCELLKKLDARFPGWLEVQFDLGDCLEELRFYPQAIAVYRQALASLPNSITALQRLHWQAQGDEDFPAALGYARQMVAEWPHLRASWERLAETLRRSGRTGEAEQALRTLIAMAPTGAAAYERLAELQYQTGRRDEALETWRQALERDPDDEKLAHRLDFLAPESLGPWIADVPTAAGLEAVVRARPQVSKAGLSAAADVMYLMDDEVSVLRADGSTVNYVTSVAYAINDAGRDRLTHQSLRSDGRARVLHAYAVDEAGKRVDASTIRGRSVRFRQLSVGSTVVLQYRLDSTPDGYLAGHMARQWWFNGPGAQTLRSRWVLYTPTGTPLIESRRGQSARQASTVGEFTRIAWEATDTQPVVPEPSMPTLHESAINLVVSTVPDWGMFVQWEASLLKDAFRVGPDVEALAKRVFEGAKTPEEKVERLQAWVMDEVRYQQDYEGFIAGVKPHAAPVVVARRYGDCKDKAVLFITLAHLGGVQAHFALVRTRDMGPVVQDVPMQQFNHAIVYVPEQPGIAVGRFFDPTVELLDISVLRHDDQGTWSLVLDPAPFLNGAGQDAKATFTWRQIPYQDASLDNSGVRSRLELNADGSASGAVTLTARGRVASALRRASRNPEQLVQMMQQQIGGTYAGARMIDMKPLEMTDVYKPASLEFTLTAPSIGRREGEELRVKVPVGWSPSGYFALSDRRFPLLLGAPRSLNWAVDLQAPEGASVLRLPKSVKLGAGCLHFERTLTAAGRAVHIEQAVRMTCERIDTANYAAERALAESIGRALDEDIVFKLPKVKGGK